MKVKLEMTLVGQQDNAFALMSVFAKNARLAGWTEDEISEVITESQQGDYDHVLVTLSEWTSD